MVCRSMLASDIGEMDRARFRFSLGVSLGLGNRDTGEKKCTRAFTESSLFPFFLSSPLWSYVQDKGEEVFFTALYHVHHSHTTALNN